MFESGPVSAVSKASSAEKKDGSRHAFGVSRPIALRRITNTEINEMLPWGGFPRKHRRFFIAQNGRCPYCGMPLKLVRSLPFGVKLTPSLADAPSTEHVFPRRLGGKLHIGNKVVAHALCNKTKGSREPYPCEVLFARITGDLVIAMLPIENISNYVEQASNQPGDRRP